MTWVAMLAGAIVGAALDGPGSALVGAVLGWLVARSLRQQRDIAALRAQLAERPAAADAVTPSPEHVESSEPVETLEPQRPPAEVDTAPPFTPPPARAPSPLVTALRGWLFGGNTIVKAGIAILFVGLAFLAKYASEHVQVAVEWRLAGIGFSALGLLAVGWRLRLQRPGYAQVLQGGAVAVLYLVLFASFRFYGVVGAAPAFALMAAVAALAAALAVLQDAKALAVVGALGGFAAPLLVSTGSGNVVALFAYYLVLDLGIAAVAWHRTWRALNLIGFFCTFVVATAWGVLRYRSDDYATGQAFLLAFFVLFLVLWLLPARRADAEQRWVDGTLLFGLPTIVFALQWGLVRDRPYAAAFSALTLAAVYLAIAAWLRRHPRDALAFDASLGIAVVFLTLVVPFAFDTDVTAGAWALEGAGLLWLGLRQSRLLARAAGYALIGLGGIALAHALGEAAGPAGAFDGIVLGAGMIVAASLHAALQLHRRALPTVEAYAEFALLGWSLWWLLAALERALQPVPAHIEVAAWLAALSGGAVLYTALAARLQWPRAAWPALLHAPVLLFFVLAVSLGPTAPLDGGGWWAWPLALAVHAAVLQWARPYWPLPPASTAVHAAGVLVVGGLLAMQGRALTAGWGDAGTAWKWLGWGVPPALLLLALLQPHVAAWWPLRLAPAAYRRVGGAALAVGLLLWTLLANWHSSGSAAPLLHVPLVNPLDLGIAVALIAVARWMQEHAPLRRAAAQALLAGAAFVWLNAMLIRAFHHYADVPYRLHAWTQSLAVQSGIALLWSATALVLMWRSARAGERSTWMVGAALLGAVVLKLLLVDLSGTGTVTRIVSFIGVGVLMLVIGYVAPLPARRGGGLADAPR
jgi:uncharacterized membrane protein